MAPPTLKIGNTVEISTYFTIVGSVQRHEGVFEDKAENWPYSPICRHVADMATCTTRVPPARNARGNAPLRKAAAV